jgi:hypothetical protein
VLAGDASERGRGAGERGSGGYGSLLWSEATRQRGASGDRVVLRVSGGRGKLTGGARSSAAPRRKLKGRDASRRWAGPVSCRERRGKGKEVSWAGLRWPVGCVAGLGWWPMRVLEDRFLDLNLIGLLKFKSHTIKIANWEIPVK